VARQVNAAHLSATQLSANNTTPPQLSAASTKRHINSASLELSAKSNSAPNKITNHQLSAASTQHSLFFFTLTASLGPLLNQSCSQTTELMR
jgi:hypothetical protein